MSARQFTDHDTTDALLELIRNARGNPILTWWEEGFLTAMEQFLLAPPIDRLSAKQRDKLIRILARVQQPLTGQPPDLPRKMEFSDY